jgi:hypothetical protein
MGAGLNRASAPDFSLRCSSTRSRKNRAPHRQSRLWRTSLVVRRAGPDNILPVEEATAIHPVMFKVAGWAILGVGAFVCALNFYLSFLRSPLDRALGRQAGSRRPSGFPVLGSLIVALFLIRWRGFGLPTWAMAVCAALAMLDTGGLHWFLGTLMWGALHKRDASQQK